MPGFSNKNFLGVFYYLTLLHQRPILRYLSMRVVDVNMWYTLFRKKLIHFFPTSLLEESIQWNTTQGTLKGGPASWNMEVLRQWSSALICNIKWNYLPLFFFFFLTLLIFLPLFSPQKRILQLALRVLKTTFSPFGGDRFRTWQC